MSSALELLDKALAHLDDLLKRSPASSPAPAPAPAAASSSAPPAACPAPAQAAPGPQVAKVLTVEPVENSEKLLKLSVDVGGGETKQVCAGLKPYVAQDVLRGSLVVVILNLKPAKLAGQLSEAMILAADAPGPDGSTLVKTLVPPQGSEPGDAVLLEGEQGVAGQAAPPKVLKSDLWAKIVPELSVQGGRATYLRRGLLTARGAITLPAVIPDGAGIH